VSGRPDEPDNEHLANTSGQPNGPATANPPAAEGGGDNVAAGHGERRDWPYDLLGTEMQSKDAGLKGLASLVEAAGGESTG
jgi:hypothetical protein